MIDSILFTVLFEIFPDAFSVNREFTQYDYKPTEWGIEKIEVGKGTENLAECILTTAQAVCKGDVNRGLKYLQTFKKKTVQNQEVKRFTSR